MTVWLVTDIVCSSAKDLLYISTLSERLTAIIEASSDPLIAVIDAFRWAYLGTPFIGGIYLFNSFVVSMLLVALGFVMFNKVEKDFVDII